MIRFILTVLFIAILTTGCGEHDNITLERPVVTGVSIQEILPTTVDVFYEASAKVQAKTKSVISSMIMGKVKSIKVKEGDKVKKGQLLLTIDTREIDQELREARAELREAKNDRLIAEQNKKLAETRFEKNIANTEYRRSGYHLKIANAAVKEAEVRQSYGHITAPNSGIVVERNIDAGCVAMPGLPLLVIESQSKDEIVAYIDEKYLNKIKIDSKVIIEKEGRDKKAKIIAIVPSIDPKTGTFKVRLASTGLITGQHIKAKIPVGQKQAILIPKNAVVKIGRLIGVYTVDEDNIISYRIIRLGDAYANKIEVLSGLYKGDKVIVSGMDRAIDGGIVK